MYIKIEKKKQRLKRTNFIPTKQQFNISILLVTQTRNAFFYNILKVKINNKIKYPASNKKYLYFTLIKLQINLDQNNLSTEREVI